MATHCLNCGARHFTGPAPTVQTCKECPRKSVYAVRDAETKERLTSYGYRTYREAQARMTVLDFNGRVMEVYRTTQAIS